MRRNSIPTLDPRKCDTCDNQLPLQRHWNVRYCEPCKAANKREKSKYYHEESGHMPAYTVIRAAIRVGLLAHPKNFSCVDCGLPAQCYDHRDYNKPLEVDPVCTGCNIMRGPGIPFVPIDDTFLKASDEEKERTELVMRNAACELKFGRGMLTAPVNRDRAIKLGLIDTEGNLIWGA